jgi:hypothetical protein
MSSKTRTSLAIVKVNWDALGIDYIEHFVTFVVESLSFWVFNLVVG